MARKGSIITMRSRIHTTIGVALLTAVLGLLGACSDSRSTVGGGVGRGETESAAPEPGDSASPQVDGSGPPPAGAAGKACGLVTAQEAASALGLTSPPKVSTDTAAECAYDAPNGQDTVGVAVVNQKFTAGLDDQQMKVLGTDKTKKVPGLGDAAVDFNYGFAAQYHVWIKGRYLVVVISKPSAASNPGDIDGAARALVDKAIARL